MTTDFDLITVTPWRSDGRHRLYVSDRRQPLGFLDASTGTLVLTDARHRSVVEQALRTAGYPHTRWADEAEESAHRPAPEAQHRAAPPAHALESDAPDVTRKRRPEAEMVTAVIPMVNLLHESRHAAAPTVCRETLGHDEPDRARPRRRRATRMPRPAGPRDEPDEATAGEVSATDAADPERVWASMAAGRAPRSTAPHGRRDPGTTLTALLLGEPAPEVLRHAKVGSEISTLVDRDQLWQALEVDSSQIDHLLIGPGGAFILSTKAQPGATVQICGQSVVVDDTPQPWVYLGLQASRRAGRALSKACHQTVAVTTLLVVEAGHLTTTLPPPVGVVALGLADLCRWLFAQPEILTPGTIAMLADAAQQSTAWYRH